MKMYFETDQSEFCYPLEHIKDIMRSNRVKSMDVFEAVPERNTGMFWCVHFAEIGESGNGTCGKVCKSYIPRNGKSGRCVHHATPYTKGNKVTITIK